jgi:hypothetical protein
MTLPRAAGLIWINKPTGPKFASAAVALSSLWPLTLIGLLATAYTLTIAPGLTWANHGDDGGDLITAAATLGVAHPTGYPTYLLLAHLFQLLPIGNLAFRTNLLSAMSAIGAAFVVRVIILELLSTKAKTNNQEVAAWLGGMAFGLSSLLWSQAVIAEVYTLHVLGLTLVLLATFRLTRPQAAVSSIDRVLAFAVGLALGNHLTTFFALLPYLLATLYRGWRAQRRELALLWLCLAAGASIYFYLPLRAATHPPINWGGASTLQGWWWVISAEPYRGLAFAAPLTEVVARIYAFVTNDLPSQFGWAGIFLGLGGLWIAPQRAKATLLWLALVSAAFAIGYKTSDYFVHLLPVYLVFAVGIGLAWSTLLNWASRQPKTTLTRSGLIATALSGLAYQATLTGPAVSAQTNDQAESFLQSVFQQAPAEALVVTQNDRDSFALWYGRFALHERTDLIIVVERLLPFAWYQADLQAIYPGLKLPAGSAVTAKALAEANQLPFCRTMPDSALPLTCGASR